MRIVLVSTALTACAATADTLPSDVAVLAGRHAPILLDPCSREAPLPGEGTWRPGGRDIRALEKALPAALAAQRAVANPDWSQAPRGWARQYIGLVRGGRRFIYGNFIAGGAGSHALWRQPIRMCDGGPAFFGVEYDVAAARFTHIAFNGSF